MFTLPKLRHLCRAQESCPMSKISGERRATGSRTGMIGSSDGVLKTWQEIEAELARIVVSAPSSTARASRTGRRPKAQSSSSSLVAHQLAERFRLLAPANVTTLSI